MSNSVTQKYYQSQIGFNIIANDIGLKALYLQLYQIAQLYTNLQHIILSYKNFIENTFNKNIYAFLNSRIHAFQRLSYIKISSDNYDQSLLSTLPFNIITRPILI